MIQKTAAMGNWRLAAPSQQCTCSCITSRAEYFGETANHPGDSAPYSPDVVPCEFWLFPKLKSPLKGKKISDYWRYSGKYSRAADGDWENCVRSQGAYFEEEWGVTILCTVFLVSSSINVSIFHSVWLDTQWTDLVILPQIIRCKSEGFMFYTMKCAFLVLFYAAHSLDQKILSPGSPLFF